MIETYPQLCYNKITKKHNLEENNGTNYYTRL